MKKVSSGPDGVYVLMTYEEWADQKDGWLPIELLPEHRAVLLYRQGDLYPVVGWQQDTDLFMLEEGGAEDGLHRKYPFLEWKPTHFREVDFHSLPCEEEKVTFTPPEPKGYERRPFSNRCGGE